MRARIALAATFAASALVLVACGEDQQTMTAPRAAPSAANFAGINSHNSYNFSLSCSGGAGASTGAQVTVIVSSTISGRLAPLACGGADNGISGFKSYNYQINLTDAADAALAVCTNTKPIHGAGSITCARGTYSATLTVSSAG